MQNQNRFLALLVMFCLLIPLAGCVGTYPAPTPTPTATPTATPTPASTATPEPTASPTPYHKIYPITFGRSTGLSYQNEYFNIKCDLNTRWFAATSAELDLDNGFPSEIPEELREQEYLSLLPKGGPVQDYSAHLYTGLNTISIIVNNAEHVLQSFDGVYDYHEANIKLIRQGLIDAGATMVRDEHTTAMFAGTEQSCWFFTYDSFGYTTYNAQVILQQGDYTMNIYLSSIGADHTADILSLFQPVNP